MKSLNDFFAMSSLHSNSHLYFCLSMHMHVEEVSLNTYTQTPKDSRGKGRLTNKIIPG